jgi:hypothetical protein
MLIRPVWTHSFELTRNSNKWVFVPDDETKNTGRAIKSVIEELWNAPDNYYHLAPGGHLEALRKHQSNNVFCRLDIENFFNSINLSRVTRVLNGLFKNYEDARQMAKLSCIPPHLSHASSYILPYGFVQSPIIASLCLEKSRLGKCIRELNSKNFTVTVYVDDIIISHPDSLDKATTAFEEINESATRSGFVLNKSKSEPPSDAVTAFNINLSKDYMEIAPERYGKFRSRLSDCNETTKNGILGYVRSVNGDQENALSL